MVETTHYATGKRKYAVARAWVEPGDGTIQVNKRPVEEYFTRLGDRNQILLPFETTGTSGQYNVRATLAGVRCFRTSERPTPCQF